MTRRRPRRTTLPAAPAPHPHFHELRAAELEFRINHAAMIEQAQKDAQAVLEQMLRDRLAPLVERRRQIFASRGLDTSKNYQFNPITQSVTEIHAQE